MKQNLTSKSLIKMWCDFWNQKEHKQADAASLVPSASDTSVLFTTAGMQQFVPYLLGKEHPLGKRLFSVQPCVRTNDIEEVGDNRHHTMFFMLGNWSLGDYFKKEAISWSWEFLTSPRWLDIPKERLAVTVFKGDDTVKRDDVSAQLWQDMGMSKDHIFFFPKKDNWWEMGSGIGPCGPDTEIFFDTGKNSCGPNCDPSCDCGKWVEIWNNVFMEFLVEKPGDPLKKLPKQNVDTGMGMERVVSVLNGYKSTYQNDCFLEAISVLENESGKKFDFESEMGRNFAIICDHVRASVFLLADQNPTVPSNVGQGYILRRLIRRSVNCARNLKLSGNILLDVAKTFLLFYEEFFPHFMDKKDFVLSELKKEVEKFEQAIDGGMKEFNSIIKNKKAGDTIDGITAFHLFDTFGFPLDMTIELAQNVGVKVDVEGFNKAFAEHQQKSRDASAGMFKGGVAAATNEKDKIRLARLHTATHLLHAGLHKFVSDDANQRGSNITPERLRFDFACDHKLTPEELKNVEDFVNEAIAANAPITCEEMSVDEAKKSGAIGIFESKYGDKVKVYTMGKFSKEICGGPHANSTGELKKFKILKEESSSSGVRRIKAVIFDD